MKDKGFQIPDSKFQIQKPVRLLADSRFQNLSDLAEFDRLMVDLSPEGA